MDRPLSERLRERAEFEDRRVLDEAKALGFVPEVYTGSQTGALLLEAAAALEAAREESDRWRGRYRTAIDQARWKAGQEVAVPGSSLAEDYPTTCAQE